MGFWNSRVEMTTEENCAMCDCSSEYNGGAITDAFDGEWACFQCIADDADVDVEDVLEEFL